MAEPEVPPPEVAPSPGADHLTEASSRTGRQFRFPDNTTCCFVISPKHWPPHIRLDPSENVTALADKEQGRRNQRDRPTSYTKWRKVKPSQIFMVANSISIRHLPGMFSTRQIDRCDATPRRFS